MYNKKGSYTVNSDDSKAVSRPDVMDLTTLISRMQKNADQVEKNILLAEEKLTLDSDNRKKGLGVQYQKENSTWMLEAEDLLGGLFVDLERAKKLGHPQADEIGHDLRNLQLRSQEAYDVYHDVYEQTKGTKVTSKVDWPVMLSQKEKQVNMGEYGPGLPDVEKQVASHNIFQKEIEAYRPLLEASATTSPGDYAAIQKQYKNLLENAKQRSRDLNSLYDFLLACSREKAYLKKQQEKVLQQDWSERNLTLLDVSKLDENFKNRSLQSHEKEASKLQGEGDRLMKTGHPASSSIKAARDALQTEWQRFLSLSYCREKHLSNLKDYRKFQTDTDTLSSNARKLRTNLDLATLGKRSNVEMEKQLKGDEGLLQQSEDLLAQLRESSTSVVPVHLRHSAPNRSTLAEALCDWSTAKDSVAKGELFTLSSNADPEFWRVETKSGTSKTVPGACILLPPPDRKAADKVNRLEKELDDVKKKRATILAGLKTNGVEVIQIQHSEPVSSSKDDSKTQALASQVDRINKDLERAKQSTLGHLRVPLDHKDPVRDLSDRLQEQGKTDLIIRNLDLEMASAQREIELLQSQKPGDPAISALRLKLDTTKNNHSDITSLAELYTKKASAAVYLENQMEKVDVFVSGLEDQLAEERPLADRRGAIQDRSGELQRMTKSMAMRESDMQQLGRDLDTLEKLCSSLQARHQEYCPDLGRQQAEVQRLRKRYSNASNQLRNREILMQEVASKNQAFQSTAQSLNSFLNNLPNNKIRPSDGLPEINTKMNSQKRVVEDIKRRKDDLDRVAGLSLDLQSALNEYDANCNKYRTIVDDSGTDGPKPVSSTLAQSVQKQERDLRNRFSEATVENEQLLNQMGFAKNFIAQNEERPVQVVVQQRVQVQNQQQGTDEVDGLKKNLAIETSKRSRIEDELDSYQKRMISLKSRRGVERVEEKEVVQYYRDPSLESRLQVMLSKIHDEALKHSRSKAEIEAVNKKIVLLESELRNVTPKLVTKEVTEFERDPKLDEEAARIREEFRRLKEEIQTKETETVHMRTEISILESKRPSIKERVVKKEVVKLEKDPEMVRSISTFQAEIASENERCKNLNDEIFRTRRQINVLERIIPTVMPKIVVKEVKSVERDPELENELKRLIVALEEERISNKTLMSDIEEFQLFYTQVEKLRQKIEVKETINEVFQVDPETEKQLVCLKKNLEDSKKQRTTLEEEMSLVRKELHTIRSQKPKVELKEMTQEVVKEEKSPEIIREMQRLKDQLSSLQNGYNSTLEQLTVFRKERDEWKAKNSKMETKTVTREVVRYENDPLLEKEADRLRKAVREETQRRRATEETLFDLQQMHFELERQKPEERVVLQEVQRLQRDPKQTIEHERLSKTLDEEVKSRRKLELEVQQLRALVKDKKAAVAQMDEKHKKIQVEMELRQIKSRIVELESTSPPVTEKIVIEEVIKVERDPMIDKLSDDLHIDINKEREHVLRLEKDIQNLTMKVEVLQREKSVEKTVYKEVIRVERDEAVETERAQLRERVSQEKSARQNVEDEIQRLGIRLKRLQSSKESFSLEISTFTQTHTLLLKERDDLLQKVKQLESEKQNINISLQQQSELFSERNQLNRRKSIMLEAQVAQLERDILEEKNKLHKREIYIKELQSSVREESTETKRETNVSTRITILDPETGKDMSPYDAYREGLIDKNHYLHLQELECNWEEITSSGPGGETFVLKDRKSGKEYSIESALKAGRLTQFDIQRYKDGKIPISEFALLVAGETKTKPSFLPEPKSPATPLNSISPLQSSRSIISTGEEHYPIAGLYDTTTKGRMSVRSALTRNLIDINLACQLLEAQAATGGIIDITNRSRHSVHKAAACGLIDRSLMQPLMNAQKAFTGVEDPATKERLAVGQAVQKGWIPKEGALRFMQSQVLTGGLVDPKQAGRIAVADALKANLIDGAMAEVLKDDSTFPKDLSDPITKEKINYKEAIARCKKDPSTDLLLLPVASTEVDNAARSYSSRSGSYGFF